MYNFNSIAISYTKSTKVIPEEYITLINETFQILKNDHVIDLGCGSGEIALMLAKPGVCVTGIDLSKSMINIAKSRDLEKIVNWEIADVNKINFREDYYKLIFSYESFHLFSNMECLLNKIAKSLVSDGYFCIGYCLYNWEEKLYKDILQVLSNNKIYLKDWFFQKPTKIIRHICLNPYLKLSIPNEKFVSVNETWTAQEISNFIISTSLFLNKKIDTEKIKNELFSMINKKYGMQITGETKYFISYSQKQYNS